MDLTVKKEINSVKEEDNELRDSQVKNRNGRLSWSLLTEFEDWLVNRIGSVGASLAGCFVGTVVGFALGKGAIRLIQECFMIY